MNNVARGLYMVLDFYPPDFFGFPYIAYEIANMTSQSSSKTLAMIKEMMEMGEYKILPFIDNEKLNNEIFNGTRSLDSSYRQRLITLRKRYSEKEIIKIIKSYLIDNLLEFDLKNIARNVFQTFISEKYKKINKKILGRWKFRYLVNKYENEEPEIFIAYMVYYTLLYFPSSKNEFYDYKPTNVIKLLINVLLVNFINTTLDNLKIKLKPRTQILPIILIILIMSLFTPYLPPIKNILFSSFNDVIYLNEYNNPAPTKEENGFIISSRFRVKGTKKWKYHIKAKPGDIIRNFIEVRNNAQQSSKNTIIKIILPKGTRYIPESTKLYNTSNPDGLKVSDNIVANSGMNVGSYKPNGNFFIVYSFEVDSNFESDVVIQDVEIHVNSYP